MITKPTYKVFGPKAILIEWESKIDEKILKDILRFRNKLFHTNIHFHDLIMGYNSLTIIYKESINNFLSEIEKLKHTYKVDDVNIKEERYIWEIPVCYENSFGLDLKDLAKQSNMSVKKIVQLHTNKLYTVFFIGFLPGFLYLGGLDHRLFFDRKNNPRLNVPKGAVAIGGKQTGIYPMETSGGWNIIGNTPVNFFNIDKKTPCFAKSGDKIKFKSITKKEFTLIKKEITVDKYEIKKYIFNA